jgi:hypothetical protein
LEFHTEDNEKPLGSCKQGNEKVRITLESKLETGGEEASSETVEPYAKGVTMRKSKGDAEDIITCWPEEHNTTPSFADVLVGLIRKNTMGGQDLQN